MLLFHAIIQKNINFLRRSSKKYDFIIENIFEEVNIIDDIKIIELYFERNEQAIKETDIKYGKFCRNMAYKILNNHQDSEECVNTTYLEMWIESHRQGLPNLKLIFPELSEVLL